MVSCLYLAVKGLLILCLEVGQMFHFDDGPKVLYNSIVGESIQFGRKGIDSCS